MNDAGGHDGNACNFSAGPGALPASVLRQAAQAVIALPDTGISVLGMSHRSSWFRGVLDEAEQILRALLGIPDNYHVLFLQGGGSLQFAMLPINVLRGSGRAADYIVSGYWSAKAPPEARLEGGVRVVWDGSREGFRRLPEPGTLALSPQAAYLHYVSNETVEGLEFDWIPGLPGVPLACDMSSSLLSRPIDVSRYAMIYAHAQKNLGPSGVTLVIVRDDFLPPATRAIPTPLDYRKHIAARSIYNTPPVFAIYVLLLVARWIRDEVGGLARMGELNRDKAALVHAALDAHPGVYRAHADRTCRSRMNVVFGLASAIDEERFLRAAGAHGLHGLEGHRSVGGLRASLYNAVTPSACAALAEFMHGFAHEAGGPR